MDQNQQARKRVTANIEAMTGRAYCASCQRDKPLEGGKKKALANGTLRFMCSHCIANRKAHMASRAA